MSNRTTPQEGEKTPESREKPSYSRFMVYDSFSHSISSPAAAGEEVRRLSRQQLEETAARLSDRDREILTTVQRYRYLLTGQIQRLHFTESATPTAAHRAAIYTRYFNRVREGNTAKGYYSKVFGHMDKLLPKKPKPPTPPVQPPPEPVPDYDFDDEISDENFQALMHQRNTEPAEPPEWAKE